MFTVWRLVSIIAIQYEPPVSSDNYYYNVIFKQSCQSFSRIWAKVIPNNKTISSLKRTANCYTDCHCDQIYNLNNISQTESNWKISYAY